MPVTQPFQRFKRFAQHRLGPGLWLAHSDQCDTLSCAADRIPSAVYLPRVYPTDRGGATVSHRASRREILPIPSVDHAAASIASASYREIDDQRRLNTRVRRYRDRRATPGARKPRGFAHKSARSCIAVLVGLYFRPESCERRYIKIAAHTDAAKRLNDEINVFEAGPLMSRVGLTRIRGLLGCRGARRFGHESDFPFSFSLRGSWDSGSYPGTRSD